MSIGPAPPGTARTYARPDGGRASTPRRASWVVPKRASCLAFGPGTTCHASFRAGPARVAHVIQCAGLARDPLHQRLREREVGKGRQLAGSAVAVSRKEAGGQQTLKRRGPRCRIRRREQVGQRGFNGPSSRRWQDRAQARHALSRGVASWRRGARGGAPPASHREGEHAVCQCAPG
jgi:hypothetical protein